MDKVAVIYGSSTGNTETAAKWVRQALAAVGIKADILNAADIKAASVEPYDLIVCGSSTWGQGELQDDFMDVYEELTADILNGKRVAVFGCGDSDMFPDNFCQAVDMIAGKAKECGAEIIGESFKIDGDVGACESDIKEWAKGLI